MKLSPIKFARIEVQVQQIAANKNLEISRSA